MQVRHHATILMIAGVLAAVSLALAAALAVTNYIPRADPDISELSNRAVSYNGTYTIYYKSELDPIVANREHKWTLHIEKKGAGLALDFARVFVSGFTVPDSHPLPAQPRVTRMLGNGNYLMEGVKFDRPGEWVLYFYTVFGSDYDTVEVHVLVK